MTAGLLAVLEQAQARGFLGPGPVGDHVEHARALAELAGPAPQTFVELGAGGGVPGLVLLGEWARAAAVLVESQQRRCRFLGAAIEALGYRGRAVVACGRAEELARRPEWRGMSEVVVARSFGPPAVTAECGVGFLRPGGRLVVAEPPAAEPGRWPAAALPALGLSEAVLRQGGGASVAVMTRAGVLDDRWPRRPGVPAKRPLWRSG